MGNIAVEYIIICVTSFSERKHSIAVSRHDGNVWESQEIMPPDRGRRATRRGTGETEQRTGLGYRCSVRSSQPAKPQRCYFIFIVSYRIVSYRLVSSRIIT